MNIKIFKTLFIVVACFLATQVSYAQQVVTTLAGNGTSGNVDATGATARFNYPFGVAYDGNGNLFVADYNNNSIRKTVIATGVVSILAGSTTGASGAIDGTGTAARFTRPIGITYDGSGNLFVTEGLGHRVRKIVIATGVVSTLAGTGTGGNADGTGVLAEFNRPTAIVYDNSGNLFVTEGLGHRVRKIVIATGVVTTFAGSTTGASGAIDGIGTAARFDSPYAITYDGSGNLFVADFGNHSIRKIVIATKGVTIFAGSTAGAGGAIDGIGTVARFNNPVGITYDGLGNLFVTDRDNYKVRKIVIATKGVTTFAGSGIGGNTDGIGTAAEFNFPFGITYDGSGNLFVTDKHSIRKITVAASACLTITPPAGTDNYWMGCTNNDWNDATNWSAGTVPTASEVVYVPVGATRDLVITTTATCAKMIVQIGAKCIVDYNAGGKLLVKF